MTAQQSRDDLSWRIGDPVSFAAHAVKLNDTTEYRLHGDMFNPEPSIIDRSMQPSVHEREIVSGFLQRIATLNRREVDRIATLVAVVDTQLCYHATSGISLAWSS